ncbi:MAG: hypothetical protein MJ231_03365 [bacterium]|nr:hypothetical protein [bacterium]
MFKTLNNDRATIERKYHNSGEPFDALKRFNYNGYECDSSTGLTNDEIKVNVEILSQKMSDLPHPVAKANIIKYVLENTRIDINQSDYFITLYCCNRLAINSVLYRWNDEKFSKMPEISEIMNDFNDSGAVAMWPDFDHVVPDWQSLLELGFVGIRERARKYRKLHEEKGTLTKDVEAHFDGIEVEYTAIIKFIDRLYKYALTKTHNKAKAVSECLKSIRDGAPKNIYEAMQVMYIYFMISESVDFYQVRSLGNGLDNTLYSFYKNDLKNGTYTRDEIKEFLGYFMLQWQAIGNYWGQPFYMGGTDENGNTKINDLSYDIIDVYDELGLYNPKIQIKANINTPKKFLYKIFDMIRNGKNSFVFCCEPGMIKAVMGYGATYDEALNMDIRGCYETGVRANEVCTCSGYVNALKPVLFVLYNGYDTTSKKQVGINTGDINEIKTFDDFYSALLKQWSALIEKTIFVSSSYEKYLGLINPSSLYSATIEGSLEKGLDAYQNGVKYNTSAILNCGLASMVDSVMAIKEFVFDKKEITLETLRDALDANWKGYEKIRLKVLNSKHKYGNGDPDTDMYAEALSRYFCMRVNNRPNARGGVYKAILHSAREYVWQGELTQATPDGRKAGEEISKNASPSVGMDKQGVTALVKSALKLKPYMYHESFCLDVMLHSSAVTGNEGLKIMDSLLNLYIKNDGMSIQFNVFNADTLRDAQKNPEKYKNLQVRVCGWNVLWNNLSRKEQDAYICRADNIQQ